MQYAVVRRSDGHVLAIFETFAEARAYTDRHACMEVVYTRSGKQPTADMHTVQLDRLEHYRRQLKEAAA